LQLAKERLAVENVREGTEPLEIVERKFTMADVAEAVKEGRVIEAFAAGTAVSNPFFIQSYSSDL